VTLPRVVATSECPETLRLDHTRIVQFQNDVQRVVLVACELVGVRLLFNALLHLFAL
jgi:hypothetical protein